MDWDAFQDPCDSVTDQRNVKNAANTDTQL